MSAAQLKIFWRFTLPTLVFLIVPIFYHPIRPFFHGLVNLFAGERSYTKTTLFFAYIFVLSVLLIYSHIRKTRQHVSDKKKYILIFILISALLINLVSFFVFSHAYNFSVTDYVISVNKSELSSSQFVHNHVFKGVIGIFAQFFSGGVSSGLDPGTAYLNLVPSSLFVAGAIIFLSALFYALYYFYISASEYIDKNFTQAALYLFTYSIATYILIKNILDGGFFDFAVLPALVILALVLFGYTEKKIRLSLVIFSGIYLIILSYYFSPAIKNSFFELKTYSYRISTVFIILLVLYYFLKHVRPTRIGMWLSILLLVAVSYPLHSDSYAVRYRLNKISPNDGAVVALYSTISDPAYTPAGSVGDLHYYVFKPVATTTVGAVVDKYKLLDNFFPVSLPWSSCVPFDNALQYKFILTTLAPAELKTTDIINVEKFTLLNQQGSVYKYAVSLRMNPCLPWSLATFQEYFKQQGINTFFMTGIKNSEYAFYAD